MQIVRETKRSQRRANVVPAVAITGYTNAGKSSLLNRITDAGVLVEDALFATLDPTTRKTRTADGRVYTLTDTVGFVRHLPHELVESFRSTLEEVAHSDLIMHVIDGSVEQPENQVTAVREVLESIDAGKVAELLVVNKIDAADEVSLARLRHLLPDAVFVSAHTGAGMDDAPSAASPRCCRIRRSSWTCWCRSRRARCVGRLHAEGTVLEQEHTEHGTHVRAKVQPDLAGRLSEFVNIPSHA